LLSQKTNKQRNGTQHMALPVLVKNVQLEDAAMHLFFSTSDTLSWSAYATP